MLQYSCSARVTALHTGLLNARRLVRMVTHPIVAATSNTLWSYSSVSQVCLRLPQSRITARPPCDVSVHVNADQLMGLL